MLDALVLARLQFGFQGVGIGEQLGLAVFDPDQVDPDRIAAGADFVGSIEVGPHPGIGL